MIKKHKDIWNNLANDTRYFVITGGRGSGKSFEVNRFLTFLSFEPNHKILFTRQTMTSAHLSIIPEFKEKIDYLNLNNLFSINKTLIQNKVSNSEIIFKGIKTSSGDQTANLKSLQGVTTWVLDEAEEQTSDVIFDKINLSIRKKGIKNRIITVLNPATKEHFLYKRFFENAGVPEGFNGVKDNVTYIHTTYLDNIENLDETFIQECEQMKINNPTKYQHVIMGGWLSKAEGVVYTNWEIGNFVSSGIDVYGQDFGFSIDPTTLVKCSIDKLKKIVYVHECYNKTKLSTTEIFNENKKFINNELLIADSAEPRLINELKSKGLNIKAIAKPLIIDRIALLQDYKMVVTSESINIIKELNNYVWHDKKSNTPIDAYNHNLDAIGYVVWNLLTNIKTTYKIYD